MYPRRRYNSDFMRTLNQPSAQPSQLPGYNRQQERGNGWRQICNRHNMLRRLSGLKSTRVFAHDDAIHDAVIRGNLGELEAIRDFRDELNEENYCVYLQALMKVDEVHNAISLRRFDMSGQRLEFVCADPEPETDTDTEESDVDPHERPPIRSQYGVHVEGLSNGQPSLILNDHVVMIDPSTETVKIARIVSMDGDMIALPKGLFNENDDFLRRPLDIYFVSGGLTYEYYDKALERARVDLFVQARIFEGESEYMRDLSREFSFPKISIDRGEFVELNERLAVLNEPQREAVEGILTAECRPKPYIVFGPPGTGKTHTLVEAIVQIYVRQPEAKILFCANSNTCADQTVEKLKTIELIAETHIYRLNARARPDNVNSCRILVTTNMKSASLLGQFEFDWVFIDEAGHAHEPETLLPICSVKKFGCLVLAGDPEQLGPVVQCDLAAEKGLGASMLDRMFRFRIYRKDRLTNSYNSRYITKLLYSYRCDPRILAISNKIFYDNELVCRNETPNAMMNIMNLNGPVQFHHVRGNAYQPPFSTSWRNETEAVKVVDLITRLYKMGLKPDQIGVITPYKLQARFIVEKLTAKLNSGLRNFLEDRFQVKVEKQVRIQREGEGEISDDDNDDQADRNRPMVLPDFVAVNFGELRLGNATENGRTVRRRIIVEYQTVVERKKRDDMWVCKINTVDAFQGDERDIIIMSTVRTPCDRRTGFIDEARRFNVALSRAKWLIFVFGHKEILDGLENWQQFLSEAEHDEVSRWPRLGNLDDRFCGLRCQRLFTAN